MTEFERTEPVSWLRLERYHLGELSPEDAAQVERAIETDAATAECLDRIREPLQLNPRPELDAVRPKPKPKRSSWTVSALAALTAVITAVAALAIYVVARPPSGTDGTPPARFHTKGGDVAIQLVRQRRGLITTHPTSFANGDAFKVLLTCPPSMTGGFDVVVFQGRDVSRPLAPLGAVTCGNAIPLPGAFTLTGTEPAVVCAAWGAAATNSANAEPRGPLALRDVAVCTTVVPDR